MKKYCKKSEIVEAEQWHEVSYDKEAGYGFTEDDKPIYHLGVGYYRRPVLDGQVKCGYCENIMHEHGWVDIPKGGYIVCPGDWIVKNNKGELHLCKSSVFETMYEVI